ncbi:MAG: aldo/keto reductase [Coriobacteriia bacterium]
MEHKKLGFGFMRLPVTNPKDQTSVDMEMLREMVDTFLERGFTYFDTAYMYHGFRSEIALREALVKRHPRDAFTVATKLPTMFLKKEGDQERIFDEQLEKCGVDYFDYYLLHNLGVSHYAVAEKFDSFGFIGRKKAEGKIRNIGFSYHDNAELLDQILAEHPEIDFVQLQLNYLDWEDQGIQSRKCYEVATRHGKPVIVMEPVKGGTLANVPAEVESLFRSARPDFSAASWAIRFAASFENVMMVLSGMSDAEQLLDNTGYMQEFVALSEREHEAVREAVAIIRRSIPIGCTACRYCVDGCPKNIAIPEYFALFNAEKQAENRGFSTQRVYYDNYIRSYGRASECIACRRCEKSCPQHLPIVEHLADVAGTFEVPLAFG